MSDIASMIEELGPDMRAWLRSLVNENKRLYAALYAVWAAGLSDLRPTHPDTSTFVPVLWAAKTESKVRVKLGPARMRPGLDYKTGSYQEVSG